MTRATLPANQEIENEIEMALIPSNDNNSNNTNRVAANAILEIQDEENEEEVSLLRGVEKNSDDSDETDENDTFYSVSSSRVSYARCAGAFGVMGFVGGLLFIGINYMRGNSNSQDDSPSTPDNDCNLKPAYTFTTRVPYQFGGELCIQANDKLAISAISFQTNAVIDRDSIWGSLAPWDATFTAESTEGLLRTYTLSMQTPQNVPVGSEICLSYNSQYSSLASIAPFNEIPRSASNIWMNAERVVRQGKQCATDSLSHEVVAYYPQWGIYPPRNYYAQDIPFEFVTRVNYAFIGFNATTGDILTTDRYADGSELAALFVQQEKTSALKVQFSVGGYCSGPNFKTLMENDAAVERFASQAAQFSKVWNAGWDIDNEWWGEQKCIANIDPQKMVAFAAKLREKVGPDVLLTMAGPGDPAAINKVPGIYWQQQMQYYNELFAMTYDQTGSWNQFVSTRSALRMDERDPNYALYGDISVTGALTAYENAGVPKKQLGYGIPLYGGESEVKQLGETGIGLWEENTYNVPRGQYDTVDGPRTGLYDYACIAARKCRGGNQLPEGMNLIKTSDNLYGNVTKQPWGVFEDKETSTVTVIAFDDLEAAAAKADHVVAENYEGLILWDITQDTNDSLSLTRTVYDVFKNSSLNTANKTRDVMQLSGGGAGISWGPTDVSQAFYDLFKEQFPTELFNAFLQSMRDGFVLSFLSTLTKEFLETELTKHGYSEERINDINLKLRSLMSILYLQNWASGLVTFSSYQACKYLNCSDKTAEWVSNGVAVGVNAGMIYANFTIFVTSTAIGVGAGIVAKVAAHSEPVQSVMNSEVVQNAARAMTKIGLFAASTIRSSASWLKNQVNASQGNDVEDTLELGFGGTGPA